MLADYAIMKPRVPQISLHRWPYGLEIRASRNGLVLQPRRKARTDWAKRFRRPFRDSDDLALTRQFTNEFDDKEWKW